MPELPPKINDGREHLGSGWEKNVFRLEKGKVLKEYKLDTE